MIHIYKSTSMSLFAFYRTKGTNAKVKLCINVQYILIKKEFHKKMQQKPIREPSLKLCRVFMLHQ